ncbi:MAG: hypothetical protein ABSG69_10940 [Candidatus Acidiferrum sp.]|jgi:hypothetical protein
MDRKAHLACRIVVGLLIAMGYCSGVSAQLAPVASLSDELTAQYTLTKAGVDSTGFTITQPGTVLMVQKGGVMAFPQADLGVLTTKYENGTVHSPNVMAGIFKQNVSTRFLTAGERVYITKLDVNIKAERIVFAIVECDTCNGVTTPANYKASITFQFPKGYLESANPTDVENTISQLLTIDNDSSQQGGGDAQGGQGQQGGGQQAAPEPAAPAQPVNITVGQTVEQVKAQLGDPQKTVNLGTKQILIYKDLKITFIKGKVTDVE